jgi:hypothetical protein
VAARAPAGLASRGRRLWREMHEVAEFNPAETVLLEEACRIADRLDRLDAALSGREFLRVEQDDDGDYVVRVDGALAAASRDANVLKQLVAALRLPDEATGKRPQRRGPRTQAPSGRSARDRLKAV